MSDDRADSFLHLIKRSQRGRLKIYLGYCAGVGKTYQMLLEAHRLVEDGIGVAAGLVETHGREETEALLKGLEIIPRTQFTYRGIEVGEMDLDAILARRPAVVLVDELAHTNLPGSKNSKRYQDVEEALAAGIHVISTLNVQHLESLYETVERATGVKVRERIPDRVVAEADQLVNVDVTPEDLRRRLREGKVYTVEQSDVALAHFFKKTNLEQLRELTLRELAAQIDARRRDPLDEHLPPAPDQVAVCLSSRGPNSDALLRYASRLAGRLNRNWYAVYVQTSSETPTVIDAETQRILSDTLTLAHQLGATVFTYRGDDIAQTLLQFAREYRVGHLVIGTPNRKKPFWQRLRGEATIVERLIQGGRGITVVVVDTKPLGEREEKPRTRFLSTGEPETVEAQGCGQKERRSLLSGAQVLLWHGALDKENALRQLLETCCRVHSGIREDEAWEKLLDREQRGGTFVGDGVGIPHVRLEGIQHAAVALGVSKGGVFDPATRNLLHLMILLLSPATGADTHVQLLAEISRTAGNEQWRRNVLEAQSAEEVVTVLREWDDRSS
jgi:two-component system, OmpR family, sensor histidine kinase KdpD